MLIQAGMVAWIGQKFIRLNVGTIGVAKSVRIPNILWLVDFDASIYVKTPLADFTDKNNQFYILPASYYKTSIVYDPNFNAAIGIAMQTAT